MKLLTFDVLLAGALAVTPLAWAQDDGTGKMRDGTRPNLEGSDTRAAPTRTGPLPSTVQRNTPPFPAGDPTAPQRVPSDLPPADSTIPGTQPSLPSPRGADNTRGTTGSETDRSTTTGSERTGNQPADPGRAAALDADQGDVGLVAKVHEAHQQEIKMGQLATDKATAPRVKAYARMVVADHKALDRQLMTYARKKGLDTKLEQVTANAAAGEAKPGPDMHARLRGETGREFDQDFMASMVDEHDRAVEMVRSARDSATDPELRRIFDGALPKLTKHRKAAQEIVDKAPGR